MKRCAASLPRRPTTAPTQAAGSVLAVTETNKLISFNNATPQKLCTSAAVTGLQNGENVLGIDTRPADGALYAVGSAGRIYTIDATTAAATLKSTLVGGRGGHDQSVHGARRRASSASTSTRCRIACAW